jgi:hypothetical protein
MNVSFERLLGPERCFLMLMYDSRKTVCARFRKSATVRIVVEAKPFFMDSCSESNQLATSRSFCTMVASWHLILTPMYNWLIQLFGEANVMMVKEYSRMSVLVSKESISQESLCPHPHCFPYLMASA